MTAWTDPILSRRRYQRTGWPYCSDRIAPGVDGRIHALDSSCAALCGAELAPDGSAAIGSCAGCDRVDRGLRTSSTRTVRRVEDEEIELACFAILRGCRLLDVAEALGMAGVTLRRRLEQL